MEVFRPVAIYPGRIFSVAFNLKGPARTLMTKAARLGGREEA